MYRPIWRKRFLTPLSSTVKICVETGLTSFLHGAALQHIFIAPVTGLTAYPLTGGVACYTLQLIFITPVTGLTAYPLTRFAKLHIVCSQSRSTRQPEAQ
jgi:hypothetical protein